MPRVTAIIATYNWSEVLPFSIGSVLDQAFSDFELIVAGDCCTDDSGGVVERYDDPRVRWLNLETNHKHQFGPNNAAIAASDSDLVAYLGHDDLWLPHHLQTLVESIGQGPGISHASALFVRPTWEAVQPTGNWAYRRGAWIAPTTAMHSRSLIEEVGGWRPPWEAGLADPDADVWARMSKALGEAPTWVRAVTSVKLPAGIRHNVYVDRPCHEQQAVRERIQAGERWDDLIAPPTALGTAWTTVHHRALDAIPQRIVDWSAGTSHRPQWMIRESAQSRWLSRREVKGVDRA